VIGAHLALAVAMEVAPGEAAAAASDSTRLLPIAALLPVSAVRAASLSARTEATLARAVASLPGVRSSSASDRLATLVVRGVAGRRAATSACSAI